MLVTSPILYTTWGIITKRGHLVDEIATGVSRAASIHPHRTDRAVGLIANLRRLRKTGLKTPLVVIPSH